MTQEEIIDYNKRCAEFLGWKNLNDDSFPEYIDKLGNFYPLKELTFDSDWNWIMEVVEAIEKLKFRFEIALNEVNLYCISKERRFSYAINYHDCENYGEEMHLTKREAVVIAINQFLIWFEQYKKK